MAAAKRHPYLAGNFAPIHKTLPLTPCSFTGTIPSDLAGGEYVRNGGNPLINGDLDRSWHWFDGDGMLSGVAFERSTEEDGKIRPTFANQFVLTDVFLSSLSSTSLRRPILPSIATLVNPLSSIVTILLHIQRTVFLVILSWLPRSRWPIKKISVANTSILFHDGRALATCESGPPMRVQLPDLTTVGWFDGWRAEGEPSVHQVNIGFGGKSLLSFMREWTTAHPKVDPESKELVLFHSTFVAPYIHYSILPTTPDSTSISPPRLLNASVPGIKSPKMMHDFGVSSSHTVIMDLPLSLNPFDLLRGKAVVSYDALGKSRFGVFPRWHPEQIRYFETAPCCIFHTANTWDELGKFDGREQVIAVNLLACRLTSATLVYSAGNISAPVPKHISPAPEDEQCRLYYYRFSLFPGKNAITHQFALSAIPLEFPSVRDDMLMSDAQYIYGCSASSKSFGAALGSSVKIDSLVKVDARALIDRGRKHPPTPVTGCVDTRSINEVLAANLPSDPIKIFKLPAGWYAQEPRFVPRADGVSEDDGWILTYVFDESQLDPITEEAPETARSELWIIDAKEMKEVVAKVRLPQRVPYGLHGNWFSEDMIHNQRPCSQERL
ncbi:carotenoid oxygenase [Glonium stellatum]|uniref:Carotenoid oxygenase n=1 Tax=Glonium stellatum TaxID=574774 RepID=A0A8E2EX84_9PEZI|nr:carotenoid oxygenase [Glonium stellatum]